MLSAESGLILLGSPWPQSLPGDSQETRASAGLSEDLSAPASSSGRWFARRSRSPASAVRRECAARPRLGSPPSYGRSARELPSTVFSYRPVFWLSRSNASTVENQRDASERPSQD